MNRRFYSDKALSISFLIAMAMVALEVSAWIAVFSIVIMFWKWGVEYLNWRPLSRRVTGTLSVFVLVQVLFQFRTLIGQEPAYTFLLALAALRVMDYQNERDHKFVVLLGFMLISVKSLFSLDIYWVLPSALAFGGLWYSLLPKDLPERTKILLKIFLLSLPLAFILFFAFPRLVIPWAMSRGAGPQGEIGFSDEINPGRVAELASNSALAFRAKITDLPEQESRDLYWRGSVLNLSRGLSWRPGKPTLQVPEENANKLPSYEVAMEPTGQVYLFVLDGTREVQLESNMVLPLSDTVFRSTRALGKASVYRGFWDKNYEDKNPPGEDHLRIPPLQGRVDQWVEEIKKKKLTQNQIIAELQKFFSENGFVYTLNPGLYGINDLEVFLFERRRGFCEHFAGAYATLARALGIPARVVVGYQGGRYNPWGDFWKISQKDAHAWVEIFSDGRWQRKDPTIWVAPLRLTIGAEDFFGLSEEDQRAFAKSENWRPPMASTFLMWDEVSYWFEDLNYQWTYFLIDFDRNAQRSFLQSFAKYRAQTLVAFLIVIVIFVLVFRSLFGKKETLSDDQLLLKAVESWGGAQKYPRAPHEAPLIYLEKMAVAFPHLTEILKAIRDHYDLQTYAERKSELSARELRYRWQAEVRKK